MGLELIIKSKADGVIIALLEDKKLIELHEEQHNSKFGVGDIYLGKVKRVSESLNASFVSVGYEKDGFLHYQDLGANFLSQQKYTSQSLVGRQSYLLKGFEIENEIEKGGEINHILSSSQNVLVQVTKEPISNKGPKLTGEITLAGRFLVLVPFSNKISISQKITDETERKRLETLMQSIKPQNFGVIIRTVAQNKKVAELDQDLKNLIKRWGELNKKINKSKAPKRVLSELNKTSAILRDLLNEDFTNIFVDSEPLKNEIIEFVEEIAPSKVGIVKQKNTHDIFQTFSIHRQIKASFGKRVMLPSGGYLIIEHTEAMHVIDVNSGNRKAKDNETDFALNVNIEAATEVARLLRLRDMGGIIAVDFIDMYDREHDLKLFEHFKKEMSKDRTKNNLVPPSKFGVVEITRQRVKPVTDIQTTETCPVCMGSGKVQATVLVVEEIEQKIIQLLETTPKSFTLYLHPFLHAYLCKNFKSKQRKWLMKYKKWIKLLPNSSYHLLEYHFYNHKDEIIEID